MQLHPVMALFGSAILVSNTVVAQEIAKPTLVLAENVEGMPTAATQQVRVLTATIKPGSKTPFHTHRFPVTVYILNGEFTLEMEGKDAKVVKAGESMVEPAHTKMTGYNKGSDPMKVVIFYVSDLDTPFLDPISQ